ncbi:MAG: hypothetical protein JNL57_00645 [Bacteroidetes bacterium]|nr:hypothetical protein [Bacteroidota bacterium]
MKVSLFSLCVTASALAQTDVDGIMMGRKNLCSGVLFGRSAWTHYWEGTFYRDNKNLGTVSATSAMAMANYGITDKLNIIAGLPWIRTKASAGTMIGREGFQDLSVAAKYKFYTRTIGAVDVSGIGIIGGSVPVTNYVADYLPLAIGMHSKNAMARLMADAEWKHFFGTISGTYMVRSNVKIDRNSYYTNEMHYTNLVAMPDVWMWNARLGYRKGDLILEAVFDRMNTQGGFDIRKNDMPFPSNNMEATRLGLNAKIPVPKTNGLSLILNGMQTVAGRNMGKSSSWMFGFFYLADVSKKTKGGIK